MQERSKITYFFIIRVNPVVDFRNHERIINHKDDKCVASKDLKEFKDLSCVLSSLSVVKDKLIKEEKH